MTSRLRLPSRREHEIIPFAFRGWDFLAGVGGFADGRLAELFNNPIKGGADATGDARDAAVALSIAAQYGAPALAVREALTRKEGGNASGVMSAALDASAKTEAEDDPRN